jgi:hypothetical protein
LYFPANAFHILEKTGRLCCRQIVIRHPRDQSALFGYSRILLRKVPDHLQLCLHLGHRRLCVAAFLWARSHFSLAILESGGCDPRYTYWRPPPVRCTSSRTRRSNPEPLGAQPIGCPPWCGVSKFDADERHRRPPGSSWIWGAAPSVSTTMVGRRGGHADSVGRDPAASAPLGPFVRLVQLIHATQAA